jgi:hypothetical protein
MRATNNKILIENRTNCALKNATKEKKEKEKERERERERERKREKERVFRKIE